MRHLTRIVGVPFGVNILGLLELFAWIGLLFGIISIDELASRPVKLIAMGGGFFSIVIFDIWWRTHQPEESLRQRLFSPYLGGCFAFLPIWLIFSVCFVVGVIALILKEA